MEQIVEELANQFLILRVSNAVGKGGNPNLLMNYLVNAFHQEKRNYSAYFGYQKSN